MSTSMYATPRGSLGGVSLSTISSRPSMQHDHIPHCSSKAGVVITSFRQAQRRWDKFHFFFIVLKNLCFGMIQHETYWNGISFSCFFLLLSSVVLFFCLVKYDNCIVLFSPSLVNFLFLTVFYYFCCQFNVMYHIIMLQFSIILSSLFYWYILLLLVHQ